MSSLATRILLIFVLLAAYPIGHAQTAPPPQGLKPASKAPATTTQNADPRELFQRGETALKADNLDDAEHAFRAVLAIDPQAAGAYANLGVIYMRRKQWPHALDMLRKAQRLAPQIAGVRLNIGLAYYRQNDFHSAIPPFESVVHDAPDSVQARYLLGLCYFFTSRYGDAATTLEPLWPQESDNLNYLYVLSNAAHKADRPDLDQKALERMSDTGQNSPQCLRCVAGCEEPARMGLYYFFFFA